MVNKKAYHDYEILEKFETGIVLIGSEIKSISKNKVNLKGSFCKFFKNELYIFDMHVSNFEHNSIFSKNIEEKRERKLLLKRKELDKLKSKVEINGLSIIPLKIYFNDKHKCKIEIALCKGKKNYDKRETEKEKSINMEIKRSLTNY